MFAKSRLETLKALELFEKGHPGDVITAKEMAEHIGCECWLAKSKGYPWVMSAMRMSLGKRIFWLRDHISGCYVCGTTDIVNKASSTLVSQAGLRAKKALRVAECVDDSAMTHEQRRSHNLTVVVAGLVAQTASGKFRQRIGTDSTAKPTQSELLRMLVDDSLET